MSELVLQRYCYSETETEGYLWVDDVSSFYTLERPWIGGQVGGMPSVSCVPDGTYSLRPHTRPNGDAVLALWNPDLGVYYTREERGDNEGRFLILLHRGNTVNDVQGCIMPGRVRTIWNGQRAVMLSGQAMQEIMSWEWESIHIESVCGTTH